jgi:ATP-dependent Clp protease ATP-binding subunit ClpC
MSEYMEKFAASRITGSPPGYVGHEEGGQLTEQVRQRPYCVVLFDEIEKAHPDVMNLLLQIMEEGKLTDSMGRKVDFKNTIIIMTSNLGADLIRKSTEVGFGAADGILDYKAMQDKIQGAVKKHFKPEFLNRLDNLIIFKTLDKEALKDIVKLEFKKLQQRLIRKGIDISLKEEAEKLLVEKGYQPEMGVRPLKRTMEHHVEDPLAEKLLMNPDKKVNYIISANKDEIIFLEEEKKQEEKKDLAKID